jgi:RNA polymerase sigma factor (sigma-70 family)
MQDQEAFAAYRNCHRDAVIAVGRTILGQDTEVEDIEQEVFLRAWQHWAQIQSGELNDRWLVTVTRNLCVDYCRKYRDRVQYFSELDQDKKKNKDEDDTCFEDQIADRGGENHPALERLLDKREAAHYLGVAPRTLDCYLQRRKIPFYKLGHGRTACIRFKRADLEASLEKYRVESVD